MTNCKYTVQILKTYLGSIVNTKGDTDGDIGDRKRKAQQAFKCHSASWAVWSSRALRTSTKIRMFNTPSIWIRNMERDSNLKQQDPNLYKPVP